MVSSDSGEYATALRRKNVKVNSHFIGHRHILRNDQEVQYRDITPNTTITESGGEE
jgi:hypothetical protein